MLKKLIVWAAVALLAAMVTAGTLAYSNRIALAQKFLVGPLNDAITQSGLKITLLKVSLTGLKILISDQTSQSDFAVANISLLSRPWAERVPITLTFESVMAAEPLKSALQRAHADVVMDRISKTATIDVSTAFSDNALHISTQVDLKTVAKIISGKAQISLPTLGPFGFLNHVEWTYQISDQHLRAVFFCQGTQSEFSLSANFGKGFKTVSAHLSPKRASPSDPFDDALFESPNLQAKNPVTRFNIKRFNSLALKTYWPTFLKKQKLNLKGQVFWGDPIGVDLNIAEPFGRFEIAAHLKKQRLLASTTLDFNKTFKLEDLVEVRDIKVRQGLVSLSVQRLINQQSAPSFLGVTIICKGVAGAYSGVAFDGLNAALTANVFIKNRGIDFGPSTIGGGTLQLAKLGEKKRSLGPFDLSVSKAAGAGITVHKATAQMFKGQISLATEPVSLNPLTAQGHIDIENIDLKTLLSALDFSRLTGTATLVGGGPFKYNTEGLTLSHMQLRALGPGLVVYKDPSIMNVQKTIATLGEFQNLIAQGSQALAFKALDNFEFSKLELNLDRQPPKLLVADIHLKGSNPDLARGQIFELNLPITGDLETLLTRSLLETNEIEKMMENR